MYIKSDNFVVYFDHNAMGFEALHCSRTYSRCMNTVFDESTKQV